MPPSESAKSEVAPSESPSAAPRATAAQRVLVLDFGSQYAQLIARRVREQHVYCEIVRHDITAERLRELAPIGIILSGGPSSVYESGAPQCDPGLFELGIPVLGICYGMQLACQALGGQVQNAPAREYGRAECEVIGQDPLFAHVSTPTQVWMSHGDQVANLADAFVPLAKTATCPNAAVRHQRLPVYGLQFHPEVTHTPEGSTILNNFLKQTCGAYGAWQLGDFAAESIERIRTQVGDDRVI
ncbi:MAG: glutamine-hydrolyzing GMP synthase, partial [Planctomycetales bacterium]|nr:glutamine-hydrolyzing GMP synthase [Planctomycetales bacterium]